MGPSTRSAAHYRASGSGPRKRGAKPPRARRSSTPEASRRSRERGPRGYDAGKRITGRKRRIVVGTSGSVPAVTVHAAASIQDRDGAKSWFPSGRWVVLPARSRSGRTGRGGELAGWVETFCSGECQRSSSVRRIGKGPWGLPGAGWRSERRGGSGDADVRARVTRSGRRARRRSSRSRCQPDGPPIGAGSGFSHRP